MLCENANSNLGVFVVMMTLTNASKQLVIDGPEPAIIMTGIFRIMRLTQTNDFVDLVAGLIVGTVCFELGLNGVGWGFEMATASRDPVSAMGLFADGAWWWLHQHSPSFVQLCLFPSWLLLHF